MNDTIDKIDSEISGLQIQLSESRRLLREEDNRGDRVTLQSQIRRLNDRILQLNQDKIKESQAWISTLS